MTLLFTDIEGSTRLLQQAGDGYLDLLLAHRELLRGAFVAHGGYEVATEGDSFFVVFASAREAVAAAREAQEALAAYAWPEGLRVSVRMGMHTGEPRVLAGQYYGIDVHHAARVMEAAHGGQVLLTQATRELAVAPVRDLGVHRLKDLSAPERIWQLGDAEFPRLRTLYQTNLPVQLSPLVGRASDLSEVTKRLRGETRLLTLTGAGGSGKTRLALHAAAELAEEFPDGIWFVPLASASDATLVEARIAQVLGVRGSVKDELAGKRLLLVLDNFEQVLGAATDVAEILANAVDVRVLATSRERLGVAAEQEYVVPNLPLSDAVVLFTDRARRLQPGFEPDEAVAEIARRLGGLPLALELAAARVKVLSTDQIAERLGYGLDLLAGGSRDAPLRQQTLRATITWSHDLLSELEQRLFRRLSVFTAGCTLDAAEVIGKAELETLASLVDKSLLNHREDRFTMLDTVRQYALERLSESGELPQLRRHHAEYFVKVAEDAATKLEGEGQVGWLQRLDSDYENFLSATDWANTAGHRQLELRLVCSLWWAWYVQGHWREGRRALERALASGDELDARLRAKALHGAAWFAQRQGDMLAWQKNAEECLRLARQLDDRKFAGRALRSLATLASVEGDLSRAAALFASSAELSSSVGDNWNLSIVTHNLGDDARQLGDFRRAAELLEQSVALAREGGDLRSVAHCLVDLGQTELSLGDHARARTLIKEGIAGARELRSLEAMAAGVEALAAVCAAADQPLQAATLLAAGIKGAQFAPQADLDPPEQELRDYTEAAITILDDHTRELALEAGRTMTLDDAVEYALQITT